MHPSTATICLTCTAATLLAACGAHDMNGAAEPVYNVPVMVVSHLYVSTNGFDTNPGTEIKAFATIARAAQAATPGTIVHVAPGTYEGGFKTLTSGSVTKGGRITYRSTQRWGAKLVPPIEPARANSPVAWDNRGNHVDIDGFDIDGRGYEGGIKWTTGIYNGGSHDAILHNHVHHIATDVPCTSAGGSGIGVDSYYHGVHADVAGNSVHDIGPAGCRFVHGIYINTPGTVRNNIVYRVAAAGIHLWHDATNVVIVNNTVTASHTGIVVGGGDFYYTKGPNDYTDVLNNIVYDNKMGIAEQGATGKHNRYRNNLVFQNTDMDWRLQSGLVHQGTLAQPPGFLAYSRSGTPDFRLAANSPAAGTGLPGPAVTADFHGKPRTGNAGIDMGALQR